MKLQVRILGIMTVIAVVLSGTALLVYAVKPHTIFGEVKKVDAVANTLTVERTVGKEQKESIFHIDPQSLISRNGQKVAVEDLKGGEHIAVRYTIENGKLMATSISLKTQAAKQRTSSKP